MKDHRICFLAASGIFLLALCGGDVRGQGRKSLEPKDGLICLLVNRNSGRCLGVAFSSVEPGAKVVQGPLPAQATESEQWKLITSGEAFRLRNEKSGLVLEIGKANKNRGVQAIQWHDQKWPIHQHWTFEPIDDAYLMRVGHSQLVLGVQEGKMEEGARAIQWTYVPGVPDQLWLLRPTKEEDIPADEPVAGVRATSLTEGWLFIGVLCGGTILLTVFCCGIGGILYWRRTATQERKAESQQGAISEQSTSATARCPGCGTVLKINANGAGKKIKCSKCGAVVRDVKDLAKKNKAELCSESFALA